MEWPARLPPVGGWGCVITSIWNTICHERIMWLKMPYGIGMKPEYDMKPENEHEHENNMS